MVHPSSNRRGLVDNVKTVVNLMCFEMVNKRENCSLDVHWVGAKFDILVVQFQFGWFFDQILGIFLFHFHVKISMKCNAFDGN